MAIKKSTNQWKKNRDPDQKFIKESTNRFDGGNITSDVFSFDDINSGTPFGAGSEFGGIRHFEQDKNNP